MTGIYTLRLNRPISEEEFQRLLWFASEDRRARILRHRHYDDACRSLAGDLLVRYALKKAFGLCDSDLCFGKSPHGKPILLSHPEYNFNLSHSGSHIAAGVGPLPLGVDTEVIRRIDLKLAKRFFAEEEYRYLADLPEDDAQWTFFRLWTLKESFVKAIGTGLKIPLSAFRFQLAEDIKFFSSDFQADQFAFHQILLEDAVLSACACLPQDSLSEMRKEEFTCTSLDWDTLTSII